MASRTHLAAALLAAAVLPGSAGAQRPVLPHVLAFSDTASVRVEVRLPGRTAGMKLRGTIVGAARGDTLWAGELGTTSPADGAAQLSRTLDALRPRRWSPASPELYTLTVTGGRGAAAVREQVRFGFRRFEAKDGILLLNGRPIFLRGNAINPPGRMIPDSLDENRRFVEDYIRYMKQVGVNIIRMTTPSRIWFEVADELGMMVFQGHYGTPRGASAGTPPADFDATMQWYREDVLGPQANHPSVVVYALSNEQAAEEISYASRGAKEVEAFLSRAWKELRTFDPTRAYITNAGYGFGRSGEICDIHRYWGWYYNSVLSFYTLRDPQVCWRSPTARQPITLTENTGNYTAPDGAFNLVSETKQPDSQLNWTGHAPPAEQPARALRYQAWTAQQAIETSRRLRRINPHIAGLLPFTILFHDWWGVTGFADMRPKPVVDAYATAYQPVLLSWELWTPQVYAGSTVRPVAHVVNDADDFEALEGARLHYALTDASGTEHARGTLPIPNIPYFAARALPLELSLPAHLPEGRYTLAGRIARAGGDISRNAIQLTIARPLAAAQPITLARRVLLHDPSRTATPALQRLGVPHRVATSLARLDARRDVLVVGERAWDSTLDAAAAQLRTFVQKGGRVLLLAPPPARANASWLPVALEARTAELDHPLVYPGGRPFRNGMAVNPERPGHPVFAHVDRDALFLWSDPAHWTDSMPGFPNVYPVTQGFTISDRAAMERVAVLANYDHGLEGVALAELFDGAGSVLVSGFGLTERAGLDPVADRLLLNLLRYTASADAHHAHPLIDGAITWGDYGSERGVVSELYHGLLVHTEPRVPAGLETTHPITMDTLGFVTAGGAGGWNTRPSIQYVARGRRPFGPFQFTLGGSVRAAPGTGNTGEGSFSLRLPAPRSTMITKVQNAAARALDLEITVNGAVRHTTIPAGETLRVESPLPQPATAATVKYRGDRRLILLETDFR